MEAKPLTDEEIAKLNDPLFLDVHSSLLSFRSRIVATIKADRATIAARDAEIERLRRVAKQVARTEVDKAWLEFVLDEPRKEPANET